MKVLLDTSVLVAAVVEQHQSHENSYAALDRVQRGKDEGSVSAHSLAEMYAVLTKLPPPFRHTPEQACLSIEENVTRHFQISALEASDYVALVREAALAGIQGGTVYDSIVLRCALKSKVQRMLTLNLKHFQNLAPQGTPLKISTP